MGRRIMGKVVDTEFRVKKFIFNGFETDKWSVQVRRTFDDGHGYKGSNWRNISEELFDSERLANEWMNNQSLRTFNV